MFQIFIFIHRSYVPNLSSCEKIPENIVLERDSNHVLYDAGAALCQLRGSHFVTVHKTNK